MTGSSLSSSMEVTVVEAPPEPELNLSGDFLKNFLRLFEIILSKFLDKFEYVVSILDSFLNFSANLIFC